MLGSPSRQAWGDVWREIRKSLELLRELFDGILATLFAQDRETIYNGLDCLLSGQSICCLLQNSQICTAAAMEASMGATESENIIFFH
tara:strand:+ start:264 stop:527 length:264 start_codon:yes stop_codon:yes gene_type:complete